MGARSGRRRPRVYAQPDLLAMGVDAHDYDRNLPDNSVNSAPAPLSQYPALRDDGRVTGKLEYKPFGTSVVFNGASILASYAPTTTPLTHELCWLCWCRFIGLSVCAVWGWSGSPITVHNVCRRSLESTGEAALTYTVEPTTGLTVQALPARAVQHGPVKFPHHRRGYLLRSLSGTQS